MSVIIYIDSNFKGKSIELQSGEYLASTLRSFPGANFNNAISSIKIPKNKIVEIFRVSGFKSGLGPDASRVFIGPISIPKLSSYNFDNKISAIRIRDIPIQEAYKTRSNTIKVFDAKNYVGKRSELVMGRYNSALLNSEEYQILTKGLQSITVPAHVLVILYEKDDFDNTGNAIALIGPRNVSDLLNIGMENKVSSLQVIGLKPHVDTSEQFTSACMADTSPNNVKIFLFILFVAISCMLFAQGDLQKIKYKSQDVIGKIGLKIN